MAPIVRAPHGTRRGFLATLALLCCLPTASAEPPADGRYLYVTAPGIRNYLEFGGAGILVFNIDSGYQFVKRIETSASRVEDPRNIKGVVANTVTGHLHFTTPEKLFCVDLLTEQTLWERELPKGCDRPSITPNGETIYVPSFEKDIWNVVQASDGEVIAQIVTNSGSHNTVCGLDGSKMYLGGLQSPMLFVANTSNHMILKKVGPFGGSIRPFTVNGAQTRCYVCVNELLGYEVGDLTSGEKLARVEVTGYQAGPVKRHGCPSHGVGLTPDEKEVWVVDGHNSAVHVFDNTVEPARQGETIKLREQPGWVTFTLDGAHALLSTGEIIDTTTKKIVHALTDEEGREVHSEKMIEIHFENGKPVRVGDQFGLGRVVRE